MTSTLAHIVLGLSLGALAGSLHLAVCAWRARLVVRGHPWQSFAAYPLGLVPPALAVIACAQVAPVAACAVLAGLVLARAALLRGKGARP